MALAEAFLFVALSQALLLVALAENFLLAALAGVVGGLPLYGEVI